MDDREEKFFWLECGEKAEGVEKSGEGVEKENPL